MISTLADKRLVFPGTYLGSRLVVSQLVEVKILDEVCYQHRRPEELESDAENAKTHDSGDGSHLPFLAATETEKDREKAGAATRRAYFISSLPINRVTKE